MLPKSDAFSKSIAATTDNGKRLLEDAQLLRDWDRFSTALGLAVLAQEEFAKAFLLQLVADGALPWLPEVQRSMARHQCKHLLGIVIDWLPSWDAVDLIEQHKRDTARHEQKMAWLQRRIDRYKQGILTPDPSDPEPADPNVFFPDDVATALNIYRHEEIDRLRRGYAWKDADWSTGPARKVADGSLDRRKQSAFYVDITRTGEVGVHPGIIKCEDADEAIKRAQRMAEGPAIFFDEYRKLKEILPIIFASLTDGT